MAPENHDRKALLYGAVLGILTGGIMFLTPEQILGEEIRLVIALFIIVMGPWWVREKRGLDFSKGRYTMAAGILITLLPRFFMQA